jgi:integrase
MRVNVKNEPTSAISDEIFRRLLDAALRWLSLEAPKVLQVESLFAQYRETRGGLNDSRRSRARYERLVAPILKDCSSVTLDGVQRNLESLTIQDVARLMTLTRGACFVVIASLTGMRKSEICSLRADCLRSRDIGDGLRVLELKGILYKTVIEQDGQPAEWIAGYDEPHNPVRLAVETLERLPRPARDSALFSAMWQQKADRARISTSVMKMGLRAFVGTLGSRNLDVTAHQFRKTFARFVALSSLGSPFTLMRHFKHASILMTERYLCSDPDMLNEIFEAQ